MDAALRSMAKRLLAAAGLEPERRAVPRRSAARMTREPRRFNRMSWRDGLRPAAKDVMGRFRPARTVE